MQKTTYVESKRCVSLAQMLGDPIPVYPNRSGMKNGLKLNSDAAIAPLLRNLERATVPGHAKVLG